MRLTVQVTIDGRLLLIQGRNAIELPETADTHTALGLIAEAMTIQSQINGDHQEDQDGHS